MKTTFLSFLLLLGVVSCASHRDPEKNVAKQAKEVDVSEDSLAQYNNAISMIKENPNFMENQKKEMIKLVDDYAVNSSKRKKEEAQLRQALMTEMLNAPEGKSAKLDQTRKSLEAVNKERTKDLESFVEKFKFTAGADARSHQFMMNEMIRTL
jgi:hypothetical protein